MVKPKGGLGVRRRQPDLLMVLAFTLGLAVIITTYGGRLLNGLDVHAHPFHRDLTHSN